MFLYILASISEGLQALGQHLNYLTGIRKQARPHLTQFYCVALTVLVACFLSPVLLLYKLIDTCWDQSIIDYTSFESIFIRFLCIKIV